MRYLLLIHIDETGFADAGDEAREMMDAYMRYSEAIQAEGIMRGGDALHPSGTATVVRVRDGEAVRRIVPLAMHQAGNGEAIVDLAVAGLGMCQMPMFMVRDALADGRLEAVLPDLSNVPVEVHMVWPRRQHLSPRVRYVVDQLLNFAAAGRLE